MRGRYCYRDVLPFSAMVSMECMNVGLNTLYKAATLRGMSDHVFVVYAYAIAALVLLPAAFISRKSRTLPPLSRPVLAKIGLLGLIGSSSQILGYTGINFSSPTLASAISNLTPAFTFILAILFRMEFISLKRRSSQAKVIGTIVSISGAFVVTLYMGPPIIIGTKPSLSLHRNLHSSNMDWIIGGSLLTAEYILVTMWYIVQAQIMKVYPDELTVIFFYNLIVSFVAATVALITERDMNAWRVRDIGLVSVICSGIFGSCLNNSVHAWAIRLKGPFYAALFKPLSIAIAVAMGVFFLGDTLHLGSLIGVTIISFGFYTVMWGKAKEQTMEEAEESRPVSLPSEKVPLLQNYKADEV
ncbi:WAT1-related protein At3g28050-like [Syzygium oleosum]|uniref:WAT1-related protein At3g28050-like n=1 Tax=Syzygium oleosum TaxID=219896 RepID=UPI0011D234C2|nr:WAT1-related protein At3g28050-like [Syzygium oleosum]